MQDQPLLETKSKSTVRLVYFDIISILACILVCIVHFNACVCGYETAHIHVENNIVPDFLFGKRIYLGSLGVSLFFLLSGARLMYTYKGVRNFFVKRFLNIYPMFWIAFCVVSIITAIWNKGMTTGNPLLLIASIFGMDGYFGVLGFIPLNYYMVGEWFLGCILILYLFFPLLHKGVEKCPAFTMLVSITIYSLFVHRCPDKSFFLRFPEVIIGMLFIKYNGEKHIWQLTGASVALLVIALLFRNMISNLTLCISTSILVFCLCTILGKAIRSDNLKKALAFASSLTYPIFLVHHQIISKISWALNMSAASQPLWKIILLFGVYAVITVFAAWVLYMLGKQLQKHITHVFL